MRARPRRRHAHRVGRHGGGEPHGRVVWVRTPLVCALLVCALLVCTLLTGCGGSAARTARTKRTARTGIPPALLAQARPIGAGVRFRPPAPARVRGRCSRALGPRSRVHVEVFAANRVVIVPAGIGVGRPWRLNAGRIAGARCYGALVTLEPTGVVLFARASPPRLADLFRAWGQPLSRRRVASFPAAAGRQVEVFVDGRRAAGAPNDVPLASGAEVVVEVGPHVPPHRAFRFASGPG